MTPKELDLEFTAFLRKGGIGEAELNSLGRSAGAIASGVRGPHRIIAYVLKTVLFELAERCEGMPITTGEGDIFFRAVEGPFRSAIAELGKPTTANRAVQLANRLIDSTQGHLR